MYKFSHWMTGVCPQFAWIEEVVLGASQLGKTYILFIKRGASMNQFLFCYNVILHNPTETKFRPKSSASK